MNGGYYAASPDPSFLITGVPSPFEVTGISYPTITEDDPKNRPKVSALREVIGGLTSKVWGMVSSKFK